MISTREKTKLLSTVIEKIDNAKDKNEIAYIYYDFKNNLIKLAKQKKPGFKEKVIPINQENLSKSIEELQAEDIKSANLINQFMRDKLLIKK